MSEWICPHGVTYTGSDDFISGARNAEHEAQQRESAIAHDNERLKTELAEWKQAEHDAMRLAAERERRAEHAEASLAALRAVAIEAGACRCLWDVNPDEGGPDDVIVKPNPECPVHTASTESRSSQGERG